MTDVPLIHWEKKKEADTQSRNLAAVLIKSKACQAHKQKIELVL